jgi:hypothetical protein
MIEVAIEKRPRINIFKLGGAYYFKQFFDDPGLFRELEPYYEKEWYRFKMKTAGERNKIMKLLDMKDMAGGRAGGSDGGGGEGPKTISFPFSKNICIYLTKEQLKIEK